MKRDYQELLYQCLETEMGGVQVYKMALQCAVNKELKKEWTKYLEQTKRHVEIVEQVFDELNPAKGPNAQASIELNFERVDAAGEDTFNRILWSIIIGPQPYPGTKRMSSLDIAREH